jgi:two-component system, LytTR family, sensor kinase
MPKLTHWLALTAFWTFVGFVFLAYNWLFYYTEGMQMPSALAIWVVLGWLFWVPLTPLVAFLARRFPLERARMLPRLLLHLLFALAVIVVSVTVFVALRGAVTVASGDEFAFVERLTSTLMRTFFVDLLVYLVIAAVVHAIDYYRKFMETGVRTAQLEHQLARAQLETLRMQLNPHFLFNTLHAIHSLMDEDPQGARRMLVDLSTLLRTSLDHVGRQEVSLEEELDFLNRYLNIERVRFQDRLKVNVDIEPGVEGARVPNLILQPLVENAIKHGISRKSGPGLIEIRARQREDRLELRVTDNGPGLEPVAAAESRGVGVRNTQERLSQLYGTEYAFSIDDRAGGGVEVLLQIPFACEPVPA